MARRTVAAALVAVSVALGSGACAGSGYQYVKNSDVQTYFKVPDGWTLYQQDQLLDARGEEVTPAERDVMRRVEWMVAFDAAPSPKPVLTLGSDAKFPRGFARVRALAESERDAVSFESMRSILLGEDPLSTETEADVQVIRADEVSRKDGIRGNRIVFNVKGETGEAYATLDQTVLVDGKTQRLYMFVIGCESNCYDDKRKQINEIVQSWTVRKTHE